MNNQRVTFFHAPQSRSGGTRALFEELGVDYDLHVLGLKAGEQRQPAYPAINPMGKVPAIRHGGALITEQPAVFMYLADRYPRGEAGAADRRSATRALSALDGVLRLVLRAGAGRQVDAARSGAANDFDTMLKTLADQLEQAPYLLGDTSSAADVLWSTALNLTTLFKLAGAAGDSRVYRSGDFVPGHVARGGGGCGTGCHEIGVME